MPCNFVMVCILRHECSYTYTDYCVLLKYEQFKVNIHGD